jgi:hypothetical protein
MDRDAEQNGYTIPGQPVTIATSWPIGGFRYANRVILDALIR